MMSRRIAATSILAAFSLFGGTSGFGPSRTAVLRQSTRLPVSSVPENEQQEDKAGVLAAIQEKIGKVDDDRLLFPEYESGEVPRMFSALEYSKNAQGQVRAEHVAGSVLGAAALVSGTTVGAGVLALPAATAAAGFLPSTFALLSAWVYMVRCSLVKTVPGGSSRLCLTLRS